METGGAKAGRYLALDVWKRIDLDANRHSHSNLSILNSMEGV
jgi:hypothetical protein